MTFLLDTNVLVRHLTGEPPELAARATLLLESAEQLVLTDVVAAETLWVLTSVYGLRRPSAAAALRTVIGLRSIVCDDAPTLTRILDLQEQGMSSVDAHLVARAERDGLPVVTFDRALGRGTAIIRVEP